MEIHESRLLLRNLIDRIELKPETGKRFLDGVISDAEFDAIRQALAIMEGDSDAAAAGTEPGAKQDDSEKEQETSVQLDKVTLNLSSLDYADPQDDNAILCLDFGTAMSKACLTTGSDEDPQVVSLGEQAKEPNKKFPVSSTLFIDHEGKIYFGYEAIRRDEIESQRNPERSRFDSPKQHISRGDFDVTLQQIVRKEINPTRFKFTNRDLIVLYLSFLTDLACSELQQKGLSRYVRRRFAMPCWVDDRVQWAEREMRKMLAGAQILADTFSGRWADGLDATTARGALDTLDELDRLPEYVVDQGVLEAVAAASGSLPLGTGSRRLYLVIDVGAGTTDYGLFVVVTPRGEDNAPKFFEVPGTFEVLRQAGDTVDEILRRYILRGAQVEQGSAEFTHVNFNLQRRIRDLKENMFRDGRIEITLSNDTVVTVNEEGFLKDDRIIRFSKSLEDYFSRSLRNADPSWIKGLAVHGLTVVLTGGSSSLPFVRALGRRQVSVRGVSLRCALAPDTPPDLRPDLVGEYPQLAVSIGGAKESLPIKGSRFAELGVSTDTRQRTLKPDYKGN